MGRALRGEGATALETELPVYLQSKCDKTCSRANLLSACLSPTLRGSAAGVKEVLRLPVFLSPGPLE